MSRLAPIADSILMPVSQMGLACVAVSGGAPTVWRCVWALLWHCKSACALLLVHVGGSIWTVHPLFCLPTPFSSCPCAGIILLAEWAKHDSKEMEQKSQAKRRAKEALKVATAAAPVPAAAKSPERESHGSASSRRADQEETGSTHTEQADVRESLGHATIQQLVWKS